MTLRGLYAITSERICRAPEGPASAVAQALRGGARLIQHRDKWNDMGTRERHARELLALCRAHDALLIVNDDAELAGRIGADGVHVGRSDASIANARARCGPAAIIGASCSGSLDRAVEAVTEGASYVAFGRFFASRTKPDAPPADVAVLPLARQKLAVPICAIGGITPQNARILVRAGADVIAAVDGVFGAASIEQAARGYAECFR
jgi:thiamine-phosphate pyrophosphorylase